MNFRYWKTENRVEEHYSEEQEELRGD